MSTPFLREQARVRAQALRRSGNWEDDDDDDDEEVNQMRGQVFGSNVNVPSREQDSASLATATSTSNSTRTSINSNSHHTSITSSSYYSSNNPQQPHHHQPQYRGSNNNNNTDLAASARKEWRHHGTGVTQALEEQRQQWMTVNDASTCSSNDNGSAAKTNSSSRKNTTTTSSRQQGLTVSIISAQKRVDSAHQEYTAYVIRVDVEKVHQDETTISKREVFTEHRYSEFHKLHQLIVAQSQSSTHHHDSASSSVVVKQKQIPTFPARSWAGRVGNWTPSQMFAPQQYEQLIRYRLVQLDAWLVHVTAAAVQHQLSPLCVEAVQEFLFNPTPLPCDRSIQADSNSSSSSSIQNPTATSIPKQQPSQAAGGAGFWQWNNPFSFTLGSGIRQACRTVELMCLHGGNNNNHNNSHNNGGMTPLQESDQSIPIDLLRAARGLMFMTVVKGGLVISGRFGTGIVIARRDDNNKNDGTTPRWSAPCAVGTLGMGWGALAGADVTHFLVVLTTDQAVRDLVGGAHAGRSSRKSNNNNSTGSALSNSVVQLGAELSVAVGPIGRGANSHIQTGDWTLHPAYAYAHSQGLFVGMSIEGSVISVRHDVNAKFYGRSDFSGKNNSSSGGGGGPCNAQIEILQNMAPPKAAEPLYRVLDQAMQVEIRQGSFRPSQLLWSHAGNNVLDHAHYDLNSPATQPFRTSSTPHHGGGSDSNSGNDSRGGDFGGMTNARRSSGSSQSGSNSASNNSNRQQQPQHQYLHPHHHQQFLYPKENQHHYHQQQQEKDMDGSNNNKSSRRAASSGGGGALFDGTF